MATFKANAFKDWLQAHVMVVQFHLAFFTQNDVHLKPPKRIATIVSCVALVRFDR